MPQISIIIPCYNCEKTIEQTLRSVIKQDFSDYEIVLVDDGSTDNSMEIIERMIQTTNVCIRIYRQTNAGVSAARNVGMDISRGRYVLFLDADDLLADGLLQAVGASMKDHPADTLCFLYTNRENLFHPLVSGARDTVSVPVSRLLERLTYSKRDVVFSSFVYDTRILARHGLRFVEGARYGEDWEFATKYLAHCDSAILLERYGYFYRIVTDSVTRTVLYSQTDAIAAAERSHAYLLEMGHAFAADFGDYMYPRAVFSVAHRFGKARNRELFARLRREYDLKDVMRRMLRNPNVDIKSKLAAAAYLVSPALFYLISKH